MQPLKQAQVVRADYQQYIAVQDNNTYTLTVSGRFHYNAFNKEDYPVVGDFVWFRETNSNEGIIERIETRNSVLRRLARTQVHDAQVLASNVDLAFLCISCNQDFHLRKLENLLNLTYEESIHQVILLTKKDLTDDIESYMKQVSLITDVEALPISVYDSESMNLLLSMIGTKTCVLIGSSGVGKSTIINYLLGATILETQDIRHTDDQGRHTTTHRELLYMPGGGAIIDTPGMRELDAYMVHDLDAHFEDIYRYAQNCKFRDCTHTDEPGCSVQEAIYSGELSYERLMQFERAKRQTAYAKRKEAEKERIHNKKQYRS
jgi:ribosome biogenesis GTPase